MIRRHVILSNDPWRALEVMPYFKIHPCPKTFPQPPALTGHHPYFIDFKTEPTDPKTHITNYTYNYHEKPKYDNFPEAQIPNKFAQREHDCSRRDQVLLIINAVSETYFFEYENRQAWTVSSGKSELNLRYSQEMYLPPNYSDPEEISPQKHYRDKILFELRDENTRIVKRVGLNKIFDRFNNSSDKQLKDDFLNACIVLDKAQKLEQYEKSASYIFLVSAIESLIQIENRGVKYPKCETCENTQYQVTAKFRTFLEKYGSQTDKETQIKFYELRSNISHSGKLLQSSYHHNFFIQSQEDLDNRQRGDLEGFQYSHFLRLVKLCFANFIYLNMAESKTL